MIRSILYRVVRAIVILVVVVPVFTALSLTFHFGPDIWRAETELPEWINGGPDLEMRDELTQIYACMRDRAEEQMLVPLEHGSLPDRRLISAINKAAADWEDTGRSVYEVELPYFDTSGTDPVHLAFRLTGAELQSGDCL